MSDEGAKVVTIVGDRGPVLISADVHGNREDFLRLRDLFLASEARGEEPLWISVGDWVHGPSVQSERHPVTDAQKAAIGEARNFYEAKIAEQEVLHHSRLRATLDPAERATLEEQYRRDRERLASEREAKIEKIRRGDVPR